MSVLLLSKLTACRAHAPAGPWLRHPFPGRPPAPLQPGCNAGLVLGGTVLADLPLAVDGGNVDFDADDALDLRGYEGFRCVADGPGFGAAVFAVSRQGFDLRADPLRIVDHPRRAADLDNGVIPGWDYLSCVLLGLVPGGRDIGVWSLKDDENRGAVADVLPLGVGPGDMGLQPAVRAGCSIQMEGNGVGDRTIGCARDQQAQRPGTDQRMLEGKVLFPKCGGWYIVFLLL